jgi:hypothetical protein
MLQFLGDAPDCAGLDSSADEALRPKKDGASEIHNSTPTDQSF